MKNHVKSLILTAENIQQIVEAVGMDEIMDQLIERTYRAFIEFSKENSKMPIRSGFSYDEPKVGLIEWMPIRDIKEEEILLKVVAYHPQNPKDYKLPTILSTIANYDTRTGHLKAIMDGVLPTALRTGASSAVASKLFGRPDSKKLGLIGCGLQSITQLHALSRIFPIETVLYFDIDELTHNAFEHNASVLELSINFKSASIDEIVRSVDILCTATSIGVGEGPLFENQETNPWLHINAIGSDFEGKYELPKALLLNSYVCPDHLDQALIEGECQQLQSTDIGMDIVTCLQHANPHEHLKLKRTVFDSTGIALEDQIVCDLFLEYAASMEIGNYIHLENTNLEEKNPYSFMMNLKPENT